MLSLAYTCGQCRQYSKVEIIEKKALSCPKCAKQWGVCEDVMTVLASSKIGLKESWGCPICQCRQFYVQKDFNQALGCLVIFIGIVLVPWTYGLSLPVFWLIDFILHRKVAPMVICYQCGCEFRGFAIPQQLKPFMHHIGVKYDRKEKSK